MRSAARASVAERPAPVAEKDPVWAALMRAPSGPPDTNEERRVVEAARARGEWVASSSVSAGVAERWPRGI